METASRIDNSIFTATFVGVALLLVSVFGAILGFTHQSQTAYGYLFIFPITGAFSTLVLANAIKKDTRQSRKK